jgi:hypothetical protein
VFLMLGLMLFDWEDPKIDGPPLCLPQKSLEDEVPTEQGEPASYKPSSCAPLDKSAHSPRFPILCIYVPSFTPRKLSEGGFVGAAEFGSCCTRS